jgi:hypothetical protein
VDAHVRDHQHLAQLEVVWAASGLPDDAMTWKVAIRVHLAEMHSLETTRDPEGDHHRLHQLEEAADGSRDLST